MDYKTIAASVAVSAILMVGGFVLFGSSETVREVVTERVSGISTVNPSVFESYINFKDSVVNLAPTSVYATTTLSARDSATNYYLTASGTTMTLPAVGNTGSWFRFIVGGAIDTGNVIIDSAEGDNISGSLFVNDATVVCSAEDQVNIVASAEAVGDYVELRSNGSIWVIGTSFATTTGGMTCTDPT